MKELKEKLVKAKKIKFLKNVFVGVVALIIALIIVNVAPGYKRDKFKDVINLIVDDENQTENLKHQIYVNDNGTVYISEEDVRNMFDPNIFYDEKYNQIITTSDTKVANIVVEEKEMSINGTVQGMIDAIIRIDGDIYLPISDLTLVYNIDVKYIPNTNIVIIDNLDKGIIRAIVTEDTEIKFKPRRLSKNIGNLQKGETIYGFYTTSKGWRQIRTTKGILGYIKANKLTSEYIVRQDMEPRGEAIRISMEDYQKNTVTINEQAIKIQTILDNNDDLQKEETSYTKIWGKVNNKTYESQLNSSIKDYKIRTNIIDAIVSSATKNNINGVVINFEKIEDKQFFTRFLIELCPKLREIGISTCMVLNNDISADECKNIVDYIVE